MKTIVPAILLVLCLSAAACIARASSPALIPLPQKMELRPGTFKLTPDTRVCADSASTETAGFLAARLRRATGYPFPIVNTESNSPVSSIVLTTQNAEVGLGPEGYQLEVATNSVVIRALTQIGLFYGIQTVFQLLPVEVFSTRQVPGADWRMPCVVIEDWPRFPWRGLLLDVSRHFFSVKEVEQLLDAMAAVKMNVFHWHLTDDHGWRIEIPKYPKLTEVGAWRSGVGFGLDPKSTTAYGPDGRYGGFYTPDDIREVVRYAAARHITIVPEIEMPGHSIAALAAYPQFSCTGGPFTIPPKLGIFDGIYNPADEATFRFLDDVLTDVFELFPGKYVHLGGDEVPKATWKNSAACQALMKREGLKNEEQLQGWFMQRMERFVLAHGRVPIGWSEILQGGLATNTAVMDWIGGATQAATEGHDVVMTPHRSCYLCYYPSLDRPPNLAAYRPYLPISRVYAFEPIPADLPARYQSHILGVQGCVWTPDIPSMSEVEELTFPRADALAEIGWSSKASRNFEDFTRRAAVECRRLDLQGVNHWRDTAVEIGRWTPQKITPADTILEWDAGDEVSGAGRYRASLNYIDGKNGLKIQWVGLFEDGRRVAVDTHSGFTGTSHEHAKDWNYYMDLRAFNKQARYSVRASVVGDGGTNSFGAVCLGLESR